MTLVSYEDALPSLQDHLPDWWAKDAKEDGTAESVLYLLLAALADALDGLSADLEDLSADMALVNATLDGLRSEYAYANGIDYEQLSPTVDVLRAYLQAWIGATGSKQSIISVLTAFLKTTVNITGTQLTFDAGGAGFTFPADGSGLILFQSTQDTVSLIFPADGSGLIFPSPEGTLIGQVFVIDPANGGTPPGATGPGLTFPSSGWVDITEDFTNYAWTVYTKSYLTFDRAAFARAVECGRRTCSPQ
jgi:hypothetical protein